MCGILLLIWWLNKLYAENFCINCKYFKRSFLTHNVFAKCSVFPKKKYLMKKK